MGKLMSMIASFCHLPGSLCLLQKNIREAKKDTFEKNNASSQTKSYPEKYYQQFTTSGQTIVWFKQPFLLNIAQDTFSINGICMHHLN